MNTDFDLLVPIPVTAGSPRGITDAAADEDFNRRWALWVERGRVHDLRARRRFTMLFGGLAIAAVLLYAFVG